MYNTIRQWDLRTGGKNLLRLGLALIIFSVCIYQSIIVFDNYLVTFTSRIWRNRALNATGRSAVLLLGETGANFMQFIASHTPINKTVVVAERSANFSSQNILQYFLLPRPIVSCECDRLGGKCFPCLNAADTYIPVTTNFPPPEGVGLDKHFISFTGASGKASEYYLGIYVPNGAEEQTPQLMISWNVLKMIKALGFDIVVLISLGILGYLLVRLIFPSINSIDILSLSVPTGVGVLTWFVFLTSWTEISVTLEHITIIYVVIVILLLILSRLYRRPIIPSGEFTSSSSPLKQLRHLNIWSTVTIIGFLVLFILAVFISVGRSYSVYDDIANWSLKGYGIAYEKTIYAGAQWGGHGLAYPLSLPLSISIFRLASGDVLPGSKLLIPIYAAALLWGCFRFLHRRGVHNFMAYLSVFLLITTPQFFYYSTVGYANMPFTACLVLGVLWGFDGLNDGNKEELVLSGLLFGFAGWLRPEGILFSGLAIVLLLAVYLLQAGKKTLSVGFWLLPGMVIPLTWLIFAHNYIRHDQAGEALNALFNQIIKGLYNFEPILMTVRYGVETFSNPLMWGLLLPLSILLLVISLPGIFKGAFKSIMPLFVMTLASYAIPAGLFWTEAANESSFSTFLSTSFDRAYLPAAVLSIMLAFTVMFSKPKVNDTTAIDT